MAVPHTKTGYMDMAICAIYDGSQIHLGMSSAFECPIEITRLVFEEGLDLNQASQRIGITTDPKIGDSQGLVGVISKGHIMRRDYTIQAIKTALIHLQNPELYNPIQ
jgi:non-canonical (house-cleaning) NTP pyrophosphatase